MELKATRHPVAHEVIVVTDEDRARNEGNVVYRWNEKHQVGTRTKHAGERPTLTAIRSALALVS